MTQLHRVVSDRSVSEHVSLVLSVHGDVDEAEMISLVGHLPHATSGVLVPLGFLDGLLCLFLLLLVALAGVLTRLRSTLTSAPEHTQIRIRSKECHIRCHSESFGVCMHLC